MLWLIFNEVMTGFGRTGSFFACVEAAVSPDVLCLSKGLKGGLLGDRQQRSCHVAPPSAIHTLAATV